MKFKKIAAKIASLALITAICACTNAFAEYEELFYPNYSIEGQVTTSGNNHEVVITGAHRELYERDGSKLRSDYEIHNLIGRDIFHLGRVKNVTKVTCEGIIYEYFPGTSELKITGTSGCSPIARKSALNILPVMPTMYPAKEKQDHVWNSRKWRYEDNVLVDVIKVTPSGMVKKVTIEGDIRYIPDYFLTVFGSPSPGLTREDGIDPETIDLSHSNVEKIGYMAFATRNLKRIVLPEHPVTFITRLYPSDRGRYDGEKECEIGSPMQEVVIENGELANFEEASYTGLCYTGLLGQVFSTIRPTPSIFDVFDDCCRI